MSAIRRLLVATPLYPPEAGGPATYCALLERELPKRGIAVEIVKFSDVRHLPKILRHLSYFFQVLTSGRKADAILALDPVSVGFPTALASRIIGKKFFVKVVGDYAWEQGSQRFGVELPLDTFVQTKKVPLPVFLLRLIQQYVARTAHTVLVPSFYLRSVVKKWGIPEEKIHVVYNAVEIATDVPYVREKREGDLVLVYIGRLVPWKQVNGIIEAVQKLLEQKIPATLSIVGGGPLEQELRMQAKSLGDACVFRGVLPPEETQAVLASADVLVLNSSYEGLSHVLIEGLMHGKVIVATDAGGNSELITNRVNGMLVPVHDTPALTEALTRVANDATLRSTLEAGALASSNTFNVETMITGTIAVLTT